LGKSMFSGRYTAGGPKMQSL